MNALRPPRVLFVQPCEPGAYPPIIHAAESFADAGWLVDVLGLPTVYQTLPIGDRPEIHRIDLPTRASHTLSAATFAAYCREAMAIARRERPAVVWASDPLGGLAGALVSRVVGARLVYQEHDSPDPMARRLGVAALGRSWAARRASFVLFPNAVRADLALRRLTGARAKTRLLRNFPSLSELPAPPSSPDGRFRVLYHGSVTPHRLPESVAVAVQALGRGAILRIVGYETASGFGYVDSLIRRYGRIEDGGIIEFLGQVPRRDLLDRAAECQVGIALVPLLSDDVNQRQMVGASNKVYDYLAAGLPVIVSRLRDWIETFVETGYGFASDPTDATEIRGHLQHLLDDTPLRAAMGAAGRSRIENDWNHEREFQSILDALGDPMPAEPVRSRAPDDRVSRPAGVRSTNRMARVR